MPVDEIDRQKWDGFCEAFSRQHHGWLVDVEASDPVWPGSPHAQSLNAEISEYDFQTLDERIAVETIHRKVLMQSVVLQSVSLAYCPSGEEQIVITAETREGKSWTHAVQKPARVRLEHTENGADEALYVDTGRYTIVVRFPITAPMEALDGFVSE